MDININRSRLKIHKIFRVSFVAYLSYEAQKWMAKVVPFFKMQKRMLTMCVYVSVEISISSYLFGGNKNDNERDGSDGIYEARKVRSSVAEKKKYTVFKPCKYIIQ